MQEIIITSNEEGYRLRKLCANLLPLAPNSFYFKMLRKKNIVLNDKKADGTEILKAGDSVKLYLSDDTIAKFSKNSTDSENSAGSLKSITDKSKYNSSKIDKVKSSKNISNNIKLEALYEDQNIIICNKPAGVLSQKAKQDDYSINEMIIDYLLSTGVINDNSLRLFRPSVCNRLDRNTCGIILASKTPAGAHFLTEAIRNRTVKKYYIAVVKGRAEIDGRHEAILEKDRVKNLVRIRDIDIRTDVNKDAGSYVKTDGNNKQRIITDTRLISYNRKLDISELEVELITGKSHQIRAHLAHLGHPIIGDVKYGDKSINQSFLYKYKIDHQILIAYKIVFPDIKEEDDALISGLTVEAPLPEVYRKLFEK